MSLPTDALSAGVAVPFLGDDEEQQEEDDEESSDQSGGPLARANSAFQSGVDTVFDNDAFSVQDRTREAVSEAAGYSDDREFAGALSATYDDLRDNDIEVGLANPAMSGGAVTAEGARQTRERETGQEEETSAFSDFINDWAYSYPRFASSLSTGVDPETNEGEDIESVEDDVPAGPALDIALAGPTLRGARGAASVASNTNMASRLIGVLGRGARRAEDIVPLGGADETLDAAQSATRSSPTSAADDLPALDDAARVGDDVENPNNLPVVRESADATDNLPVLRAGENVADPPPSASTLFDDAPGIGAIGNRATDAAESVGDTLRSFGDSIRRNPGASALAAGGTAAGTAAAYGATQYESPEGGIFGDSPGNDDIPPGNYGRGAAGINGAPADWQNPDGDGLTASWSVSDMGPNDEQTFDARVTNETSDRATVMLVLTVEIDGEEYVVNQSAQKTLEPKGTVNSRSTEAFQLTIPAPQSNGIPTGRNRVNLYGTGRFAGDDGTVNENQTSVDLGSESFSVSESNTNNEGSGESSEWSQAAHEATLQYGWHLFAQSRGDETRYMVAGTMDDGSTRYLNGSGRVVDSPSYFDTEQDALEAHETWVERAMNGETGTDPSTRPGGTGRPSDTRVTQDARGSGSSGGTLGDIATATGVSGDGWGPVRVAKLALTIGVLVYVANRYDIIDAGGWPVIGEVLS